MKEIDFLPKWYKADKKRKVSYRRQYIAITGMAILMLAWTGAANYSVSLARGQVAIIKDSLSVNGPVGERCREYKGVVDELKKQKAVLDTLGQRTTMSSIVAEISYLCDDNVMLSSILIDSVEFGESSGDNQQSSVRISSNSDGSKPDLLELETRMKGTITGFAAGPSNVGVLISKLEKSDFFSSYCSRLFKAPESG